MNKLNTFLSFVLLSFCLLINVSYAEIEPNVPYSGYISSNSSNVSSIGSYSSTQIQTYVDSYIAGTSTELETAMQDLIDNQIISQWYCFQYGNWKNLLLVSYGSEIEVFMKKDSLYSYICCTNKSGSSYYLYTNGYFKKHTNLSGGNIKALSSSYDTTFYGLDYSVKYLDYNSSSDSYSWDGTSYYYEVSTEPDAPSLPSNAEIAQSVQLFYNTIYNQPNIAFDDFIVLYDVSTGLYSYIGHTRGNAIGQVIVEPNGYYNGYKFDKQWWQFFHDEQNDSWDWENLSKYNNYYLYSSQGTIDTLEFVGKDKIDNLFTSGPFSTSNTFIVYSTNDYPVKYITFSDESPDPVVEEGTIKGDQYTYDENLDITDNQYNPLDNFVSIDYPSTLVSRADFEEFMNVFNENSQFAILPSNANWIVIANNSLFEHFSSFIIMCTVFIILQRFMRG